MKRWSGLGLLAVCALVAVLAVSLVIGLGEPENGVPAAERAAPIPFAGERVRVEVLNATGAPGLARSVTRRLREQGAADVVFYGNAGGPPLDSSVVIARTADRGAAEGVADALGIARVRAEPDSTLLLEATILIGRDFMKDAAPADTAQP